MKSKIRIRRCKKCERYLADEFFDKIIYKLKKGYGVRRNFQCKECKGGNSIKEAIKDRERNLDNYHKKMNSENFKIAERFRRLERYYCYKKEKYLKLFEEENN